MKQLANAWKPLLFGMITATMFGIIFIVLFLLTTTKGMICREFGIAVYERELTLVECWAL